MSKKGFTLIELTVMVAVIGLLAIVGLNFNFNKKTDTEKQDRFIQKISSIIHSAILGTSSGRGITIGTEIINPTSTHIQFSTGSIGVYYYSGSSIIGTWETLKTPFFWETNYILTGSYWKSKDLTTTIHANSGEIIFTSGTDTTFSWLNSESGVILGIGVQYRSTKKTLEFDRRFGKIEIR